MFFVFAAWKACHHPAEAPVIADDGETANEPANPVRASNESEAPVENQNPGAPLTTTPPPLDLQGIRTRFASGVNQAATCLGLQFTAGSDQVEPTLDTWMGYVKPELGEPVLQSEDRSVVEIQTSTGEHRQIRVEMDYTGEDRIVRRVKYTKVNPDGTSTPIPLSPEQAEEPSETFLASLESDGQVSRREKSQRIYFPNGEEIVVTERDGRISDLEMSRNGRSFRCKPEDSSPDACHCL